MTDKIPTPGKEDWQMEYEQNMTATQGQYVPYSTVGPKIHAWTPGGK